MGNSYDHEDAFKAANLHAGRVIALPAGLKAARDMNHARVLIDSMQDDYQRLFDAFIEGVRYGRENPLERQS